MKLQISDEQKKQIAVIAKQYGVKIMVAFGSQVTGKQGKGSDLDIGLLFGAPPPSYQPLLQIQGALRAVFAGYTLDVRLLHGVSPLFLFEALYKGMLLYGDEREYIRLSSFAFKRYADTRSFRDTQEHMIRRQQKKFLAHAPA